MSHLTGRTSILAIFVWDFTHCSASGAPSNPSIACSSFHSDRRSISNSLSVYNSDPSCSGRR
ncbi:hypothetical protein M758_6G003800 [Ceratodon purpureus]|nr:hypothetical protein M758_6G003800 [Ceratodon purpureus]